MIPLVLISNVHFWNYYVPSHTWNPPQPLRLNFFIIDFPLNPHSQLPFINFWGHDNRTRGKAYRSHKRAPLPILTTSVKSRPPHLPLITLQSKRVLSHFASLRVDGGMFTSHFAKLFICALTLFFFNYWLDRRGRGGRFKRSRRRSIRRRRESSSHRSDRRTESWQ